MLYRFASFHFPKMLTSGKHHVRVLSSHSDALLSSCCFGSFRSSSLYSGCWRSCALLGQPEHTSNHYVPTCTALSAWLAMHQSHCRENLNLREVKVWAVLLNWNRACGKHLMLSLPSFDDSSRWHNWLHAYLISLLAWYCGQHSSCFQVYVVKARVQDLTIPPFYKQLPTDIFILF